MYEITMEKERMSFKDNYSLYLFLKDGEILKDKYSLSNLLPYIQNKHTRKFLENLLNTFFMKKYISTMFNMNQVKNKFKKPKNLNDLIKLFVLILSDSNLKRLISKMKTKEEYKQIVNVLDPISLYLYLTMILPLFISSALTRKYVKIINDLIIELYLNNIFKYIELLPTIRDILFKFGMPDGEVIYTLLRGII